jgi:uncharacterized membrane protein required for colicin V production
MIFLVLDILLALLILLFTPIGFWRGPIKELYVTLGVLFGILLADFWARPWGRDLSDISELTDDSGAFIVAMIFLVSSTFILGYGLGATLVPAWHETQTRVLGAVVAAFNGMLLLSFSLQYVRIFLLSDANEESLDDSFLSQFLLDQIGWVLMLAAFIAAPLLLFVFITGRRAYDQFYEEAYDVTYSEGDEGESRETRAQVAWERTRTADAQTNVLPPRVPGTPHDPAPPAYKAEPEPPRRRPTAETRPLNVPDPRLTAEPATPADARNRMGDTDPHFVLPLDQAAEAQDATPAASAARAEPPKTITRPAPRPKSPPPPSRSSADDDGENALAPGYTRCVNCHAVLPPDISICPNCGTLQ